MKVIKKNYDNFHSFIQKFVKSKFKFTLSFDAKDTINELIKIITEKYIAKCVELARYANRITVDSVAVSTLTKMWFPYEADELLTSCHKYWDYYTTINTKERKKIFFLQPSRFKSFFLNQKYQNQKISETAPVYLCCILEYILERIFKEIDPSIEVIKSVHIYDSIYDILFLKIFFKEYIFLSG